MSEIAHKFFKVGFGLGYINAHDATGTIALIFISTY